MKHIGKKTDNKDIVTKEDIPTVPSVSLTTTAGSEKVTVDSSSLNVSTRDTAQTISAVKTFNKDVIISSGKYLKSQIQNNDVKLLGLYYNNLDASRTAVRLGHTTYPIEAQNNIIPSSNNAKDLGSSSYKWKDLYLSGNLSDGTNSATVSDIVNGLSFTSTQVSITEVD